MTPNNNVFKLACEPIQNVRIGIIGIGNRGLRAIRRYAFIQGAQITAVADLYEDNVNAAEEEIAKTNRPAIKKFHGEDGWKEMCACSEIDLVYICTPWSTHAEMACHAMMCGKHVAVEVPAAMTVAPALLHARELLLRRIRPHYNETCNRRHVRHYHTRRRSIHTRCNVRHRCKQDTNLQPRTMER